MKFSYSNIFLIDAVGALITAVLLSQLLARFESLFGMPPPILYILAGIALCFAVYSFLIHMVIKNNREPYLKGIVIANTLYCVATLFLVFYLNDLLTWLGIVYFVGEIIIVLILVQIEITVVKKTEKR